MGSHLGGRNQIKYFIRQYASYIYMYISFSPLSARTAEVQGSIESRDLTIITVRPLHLELGRLYTFARSG